MATQIPGGVMSGLLAQLDTLDLSDEEHVALAAVVAAGLQSGREEPEVEGFMPTAVELSPTTPFSSLGNGFELEQVSFTFQRIDVTLTPGGKSATDDWSSTG